MITFYFKPGMRGRLVWYLDSLNAGEPGCACSLCELFICGDESLWRIIDVDGEAWFHFRCFMQVVGQREDDEYARDKSILPALDASFNVASISVGDAAGLNPGLDGLQAAPGGFS